MVDTTSRSVTSSTSLPSWFAQGYLRDDLAKQFQPTTPNAVFMATRKTPQLGMRTETSIQTTQGTSFIMSGHITWVGDVTTSDALNESDSLFWDIVSGQGSNMVVKTPDEKRQYILQFLGCVHGQRMRSVARLCQPTLVGALPFIGGDAVAEITFRFDDTMYFPWVVEAFRFLGDEEIESLPLFFYEFYEGCSCPRCNQRAAEGSP